MALTLGQRHWADTRRLVSEAGRYSSLVQHKGVAAVLLAGAAALLAAAASGLLAGAAAGVAWLGRWPRWAASARDSLTVRRAARWEKAQQDLEELRLRDDPAQDELDELAGRRDRVSLAPPVAPTWIGDRVAATDARVFGTYQLDLGSVCPGCGSSSPKTYAPSCVRLVRTSTRRSHWPGRRVTPRSPRSGWSALRGGRRAG